jgi:hypothetical protein
LGKLVQFERREGRPERSETDRPAQAEILIFTGVRYERDTQPMPPKPSASSGSKRKRG